MGFHIAEEATDIYSIALPDDDMRLYLVDPSKPDQDGAKDDKVGQHDCEDNSNSFHPSSGKLVDWVIHRYVAMARYLI